MKIAVDKVADAMYIEFHNGRVDRTEDNGNVLGLEILRFSENVLPVKGVKVFSGLAG